MAVLNKGSRNVEILKQGVNSPMAVEKQVAIIYLGTKGMLNKIPVDKVREFEKQFLNYMETKHRDALEAIAAGKWGDDQSGAIEAAAREIIPTFEK
jgi:F-type H+-transporting ATPase subunit alpha